MRYLKNYKKEAILAPVFKLVEVFFELLVPWVVAAIIDNGINGGEGLDYILICCAILIVFGVLGLAGSIVAQYFSAKAAVGFSKELRADLYRKIESLSYSELDSIGASKLITRMTVDVNTIQTAVNLTLRLILRAPIIVIGAMIMAFIISWRAGIVFAVGIVVLLAVIFAILIANIKLHGQVQGALDNVTRRTRETLTGSRVVRAFCLEDEEIKGFKKETAVLFHRESVSGLVSALLNPLTYAIINVAIIVLIYVGALQFDSGELTQGNMVSLYNYMMQILTELLKFASLIMQISRGFASAQRINDIFHMDSSPIGFDETSAHAVTKKVCDSPFISFSDVSMRYSETGDLALDDISFSAERGEVIGVIGGTGSGKSTLVNLIPHFYDVSEGVIAVDGINVNDYGDKDLRQMCGIVPQKAVLFKGTLRENILWGGEADDEEIYKALEIAQALDIVESKEMGLDEPVEQGGKNFSGGQRQRLTIARALIKKPEILILDDSASALDYSTDAKLRASLRNLDYKPCVFIVSQRTSSVRGADKIVVLDDGKAVGIGTHKELLETCPLYSQIHYSQFEKGDDES